MVGFPGLGIGEFELNGVLFSIGGFSINWYGLIIAAGFFLATLYACKRAPEFSLTSDEVVDMLIYAVPVSIIGARLYFVIFNWDYYKNDIMAALRIWDGGLAIYGCVIFAVITCALFCWVKHISTLAMLDLGAMGLLIGQAVGRWGNFFNIEVYGTETKLPWRMSVYGIEVHPLFLYESLWNALGFLLLHKLSKKRRFNGHIFLLYIAWYGLGRGALEGMRNEYYSLMLGPVRVSQILGFASCLIAVTLLVYHLVFKIHEPDDLNNWVLRRQEWLKADGEISESPEAAEVESSDEAQTAEEAQTPDENQTPGEE